MPDSGTWVPLGASVNTERNLVANKQGRNPGSIVRSQIIRVNLVPFSQLRPMTSVFRKCGVRSSCPPLAERTFSKLLNGLSTHGVPWTHDLLIEVVERGQLSLTCRVRDSDTSRCRVSDDFGVWNCRKLALPSTPFIGLST